MRLKYYQILILGIIANVTATSFFASNEQLGTGQIGRADPYAPTRK